MQESSEESLEGIEVGEGFASANDMPLSVVEPEEPAHSYRVHRDLLDQLVDIETLLPWPQNYRNGDTERIAKSLRDHGQFRAIGVNRGSFSRRYEPSTIAYGNHTYMAAMEVGWSHIAVTWIDVDDDEFEEIAIVDNHSSDLAWNDHAQMLELLRNPNIDNERAGVSSEEIKQMQHTEDSYDDPPPESAEEDTPADDESGSLVDGYEVIVTLQSEEAQAELLDRLNEEGYEVKALM